MLASSQEENTNPNETWFVSHSGVSLAYTLTITRWLGLAGAAMIEAGRKWSVWSEPTLGDCGHCVFITTRGCDRPSGRAPTSGVDSPKASILVGRSHGSQRLGIATQLV
jgi:hypothetical protein